MTNFAIRGWLFTATFSLMLISALSPALAWGAGEYGLKNVGNNSFLAVDGAGFFRAETMASDSAKWEAEAIENGKYFRLRSVGTNKYLHIENGPLDVGDAEPGWWSGHWVFDSLGNSTLRIKNRWKPDLYIAMVNGNAVVSELGGAENNVAWGLELEAGEILQPSSEVETLLNGEDSESKTAGDYAKVAVDETVKYVGQGGEAIIHGGKVVYGGAKTAYEETEKFVTGGETPEGRKAIKFNNQAGYVAKMQVMYIVKKDIGGTMVDLPETQETSNITLGFTRPLVMPDNLSTNHPVRIFIFGVATTTNPVYTTELPGTFTGDKCFKAWGTFASAEGGGC